MAPAKKHTPKAGQAAAIAGSGGRGRRRVAQHAPALFEPEKPATLTGPYGQWLRRRLMAWYRRHARVLPWRKTRDAYAIWVSETMLQQTQVATVERYYPRFLEAFPTVRALAEAREQEVLRMWEGLGYYRRARQLHAAARQIVAQYDGRLPQSGDELRRLPGIGRYTAGAVASIAFDQREPILEANTIRLLSRLTGFRGDPRSGAGQRHLWHVAQQLLPRRNVGLFNQALMELGSLCCKPRQPTCEACPLSAGCVARATGEQDKIQQAAPRPDVEHVHEAAVAVRRGERVLLRHLVEEGRWQGLWDFPRFPATASRNGTPAASEIAGRLRELIGVRTSPPEPLVTIRHGVTRFRITLHCYESRYLGGRLPRRGGPLRWVPISELVDYPLHTTARKLSRRLSAAGGD